jgi:photosystem II stability/assembly factor-like uncharacterized protein
VETPRDLFISLWDDAGNHAGAIRSSDLGQTWSPVRIDSVGTIALGLIQCDSILFSECSDKCWRRSIDYGQTWQPVRPSLDDFTSSVIRAGADALYAGSLHGPLRSGDNGATWIELETNGLTHRWVVSTAATPTAVFVVGITRKASLAGHYTSGSGLFRTTDGGSSWTDISSRMPIDSGSWGEKVVTIGNTIFSGGGRSLFKSVDDGERWRVLTIPQVDTAWTFLDLCKIDTVLLGVAYALHGQTWRLIASTDFGNTWTVEDVHAPIPADPFYVNRLLLRRSSLFALLGEYHHSQVWRSSDRGKTWQVIPFEAR